MRQEEAREREEVEGWTYEVPLPHANSWGLHLEIQ
jgi:hypothetical protein